MCGSLFGGNKVTFEEYMQSVDIKEDTVITIGNFDGVHRGHLKLMELTLNLAKVNHLKSVIFTYANHPLEYVLNKKIEKLMTNEEREQKFRKMGIDYILSVPFEESLMNMSTDEFIEEILIKKLRGKHLVLGEDAHFGKGREGSASFIRTIGKQMGLQVDIVPLFFEDGLRISSTVIREFIRKGNMEKATKYLGGYYSISGKVIHGEKNGRKMGFPTANVMYDEQIVLPGVGVYYTVVDCGGQSFFGATSVGYKPTIIGLERKIFLEVNILDFDRDIYGHEITVHFIKKIRDEMKFNSLEELKNQITKDETVIRQIISNENLRNKPDKVFTE